MISSNHAQFWHLPCGKQGPYDVGRGTLRNQPTHDPGAQDTAMLRWGGDYSKCNQQMKRIHSVAWVRYTATIVIKSPLHKTGRYYHVYFTDWKTETGRG